MGKGRSKQGSLRWNLRSLSPYCSVFARSLVHLSKGRRQAYAAAYLLRSFGHFNSPFPVPHLLFAFEVSLFPRRLSRWPSPWKSEAVLEQRRIRAEDLGLPAPRVLAPGSEGSWLWQVGATPKVAHYNLHPEMRTNYTNTSESHCGRGVS